MIDCIVDIMSKSEVVCSGNTVGTIAEHRPYDERVGYDCRFVETIHAELQTKCPVCLCVLRDPHMVDCCGYSYCHMCIKKVQESERPCPLCNSPFTSYPDKRLCRSLKGMKVFCTHVERGCSWQGDLGMLDEHLNIDPSSDGKSIGCAYTRVRCDYCRAWLERRDVLHHQSDDCLQRPYSCDYCYEYQSSCENVRVDHWLVCSCRPVSCPNECGIYPERKNLKTHLGNDCPLALLECQFAGVGCKEVFVRKNMHTHLVEGVVAHLSLQSQFYQSCFVHLESKLTGCEAKIAELEKENASLKSTLDLVKNAASNHGISGVDHSEAASMPDICRLKLQDDRTYTYMEELEKLKSFICIPPVQFTIHSVSHLQKDKLKWLSAPFYTHAEGYKMCLKVYPSGHSTSTGIDMSLYVCIMKGPYDDLLKWPFRGSVAIQLLDQLHCEHHLVRTVRFHDNVSVEFSGRVDDGDLLSGGWGMLKFASLNELVPKYLQNDGLQMKIDKILIGMT